MILELGDPLPPDPAGWVWVQTPGRPREWLLAYDTRAAAIRRPAEVADFLRRHGDSMRLP